MQCGNIASRTNGAGCTNVYIWRLSFHPIPCGSRDRPVGRKVIDEAKLCVDTALAKSRSCVFPSTGKTAL